VLRELPILTFHSIDSSGSVISVSPARFERILRGLKQKGFRTLCFDEVIDWLQGQQVLTAPSVVLTFDDGYENLYSEAFPLLQELEFKATVFLTTGYCGKTNQWPTQIAGIPPMPMLRWEQIKEMAQAVFGFEAHTQTHPALTQLPVETARKELAECQLDIEDRLGKKVRFFAYPYGKISDGVYELAREYFDAACSTNFGFTDLESDRHLLERIDMYYFSGMLSSTVFGSPFYRRYLRLRQLIRNARRKDN
jgi:peptidoglycan/xylan/chitin deacetylase (PgdA/CDA1 family)